jgi:hypothetical protein
MGRQMMKAPEMKSFWNNAFNSFQGSSYGNLGYMPNLNQGTYNMMLPQNY